MTDNSWIYEEIPIYNYLTIVYNPIRFEDGTPVYSRKDIEIYGLPDHYGIFDYIIIDDLEPDYVTDYKFEQTRKGLRPIHRYSRLLRFRNTLNEIIGGRSSVPNHVVNAMEGCYDIDPTKVWDSIRHNLKFVKMTKYINMIPSILKRHGYDKSDFPNQDFVLEIERQFMCMCDNFKQLDSPRRYFPNLRFVCVRLLELNGYDFQYTIPKIRTNRKIKPMEDILQTLLGN